MTDVKKNGEGKNVLFISMGGIGNMVLLTPALLQFSRQFPLSRLHFLLPPNGSRQVVECHPDIGTIIETQNSQLAFFKVVRQLRQIKPDLVIAANGTNPFKCGLIGVLAGAAVRAGERFGAGRFLYNCTTPFEPGLHEATANMRLVRALSNVSDTPGAAESPETLLPTVWATADDRSRAQKFTDANELHGRWVGMHLGSGPNMQYKRWPTERFIDVARHIVDRYRCRVVLFGGSDEATMAEEAAQRIGPPALSAAGRLTIRQSYEVMKRAQLFISNDSGPMHLAAAAGIPLLAIFGPTMEYKTSPLGRRSEVLTAPVACRPCYAYKPVECHSFECLKSITVERVVAAVDKVLSV